MFTQEYANLLKFYRTCEISKNISTGYDITKLFKQCSYSISGAKSAGTGYAIYPVRYLPAVIGSVKLAGEHVAEAQNYLEGTALNLLALSGRFGDQITSSNGGALMALPTVNKAMILASTTTTGSIADKLTGGYKANVSNVIDSGVMKLTTSFHGGSSAGQIPEGTYIREIDLLARIAVVDDDSGDYDISYALVPVAKEVLETPIIVSDGQEVTFTFYWDTPEVV